MGKDKSASKPTDSKFTVINAIISNLLVPAVSGVPVSVILPQASGPKRQPSGSQL